MSNLVYRSAVWLGGSALVAAALTDIVAVLARNLMTSLHGSIELIQVAVLVAGAIGLVVAVANGTYARVHLIVDRLPDAAKPWMERIAAAATCALFGFVLIGSVWIASDLWQGQEYSEILGVPWRWLRLFANLCFVSAIIVLLRHCWRPAR